MTLSELIAEWREQRPEEWVQFSDDYACGKEAGRRNCADKLEQFLARLVELRDRWVGEAERLREMAVLDVSVVRIQANQYQARADELSALIGGHKP